MNETLVWPETILQLPKNIEAWISMIGQPQAKI